MYFFEFIRINSKRCVTEDARDIQDTKPQIITLNISITESNIKRIKCLILSILSFPEDFLVWIYDQLIICNPFRYFYSSPGIRNV